MMEGRRSISIGEHGDVKVVRLLGEQDLVTAKEVREAVDDCLGSDDGLVVSLMQTEFLDSSILHVLFDADSQLQKRERRLVLHVATASIVERVLDVSGLKHDVPCTGSLDAAVALARQTVERAERSVK
jgi:anti-sigma B factor antagonist